mmetsp:Transcript_6682/g.9839  ORF Transcript_6682/g.9839 Transcript_6682/m.9839 type:complete len:349 (+) Transcript_6682:505-1551(+)
MFLTCPLDLIACFQIEWVHGIRKEYFRHTHLGDTAWSPISQFTCVVVSIVKPYRHAGDGMTIDGTFGSFNCLQTTRLSILFVHHFQIHIKFRCHSGIDQVLNSLLHESRKGGGNVKVGDTDADLAVVKFLEDVSFDFSKDSGSVSDEETSSSLSGLLETHKGCVGGGTFGGRFTVESDVMSTKGWFVDLLIERISLTRELSQTTRMQRIQTMVNPQRFMHSPMSIDTLHEIKPSEPNGTIFQQFLLQLGLIVGKVLCTLGIVSGGSADFEGAGWLTTCLGLSLFYVDSLRVPTCEWTFPHTTQIILVHIRLQKFLLGETGTVLPFGRVSSIGCHTFRRCGGGGEAGGK